MQNSYDFNASFRQRLANLRHEPKKAAMVAVLILFAASGLVMLQQSSAASYAVVLEAENGMPAGNSDSVNNPAGASGSSILFGKTDSPPPGPGGTASFPLKVSSNKRFLVGQNDVPFLMVGDTAWNLTSKLSDSEITQYLDARKNQGFNTILTSLMDISAASISSTSNDAGTNLGSFNSPNGAYFDHIVKVLQMAKDRGMQLMLVPAWSQHAAKDSSYTTSTAASWGTFAANKFKNSDNLIWMLGGDWGGESEPEGKCPLQPQIQAMATSIQAVNNRQLITVHPGIDQSSNDCYKDESWLGFSGSYWDFDYNTVASVYQNVLIDYNTTPTRPAVNVETCYEGPWDEAPDDNCTAYWSRIQSAAQILAGGLGFTYGANGTYDMRGAEGVTWQQAISSKGGTSQGYIAKAFNTRQFQNLIPDQTNVVVTAGKGNPTDLDYASAARAADGTLVMAYIPVSKTLTVDMSKLSASATARWYDPTNGQYKPITGSPFANSGSKQFVAPGNNSLGDGDWILIIETNPI